ncbi:MAG: hypothetical protein JWM21_3958 [Acidobacteria bacterium]|nr:hypothetical protein [Acidobacteriota bacterium]
MSRINAEGFYQFQPRVNRVGRKHNTGSVGERVGRYLKLMESIWPTLLGLKGT